MWYAYILRSIDYAAQRYIGLTDDVTRRIPEHNSGQSPHTAKYRPWKLEVVIGFTEKSKAVAFEHYLKSGSGFAFSKKHF